MFGLLCPTPVSFRPLCVLPSCVTLTCVLPACVLPTNVLYYLCLASLLLPACVLPVCVLFTSVLTCLWLAYNVLPILVFTVCSARLLPACLHPTCQCVHCPAYTVRAVVCLCLCVLSAGGLAHPVSCLGCIVLHCVLTACTTWLLSTLSVPCLIYPASISILPEYLGEV